MKSMRRQDRAITNQEAGELLCLAEYGILSTVGNDNQPYGAPLSYVFKDDCIYFHCALSGQKLDNIAHNPQVSFCVVGKTKILPDEFATEYESVIALGKASEVSGPERINALTWLLEKYCSNFIAEGKRYMEQMDKATKVIKIDVHHISGKARR